MIVGAIAFIFILGFPTKQNLNFDIEVIQEDKLGLFRPNTPQAITPLKNSPLCAGYQWPFEDSVPTSVFRVDLANPSTVKAGAIVIYQRSAINNLFSVIHMKSGQCVRIQTSGRTIDFSNRDQLSIFPNVKLEDVADGDKLYVVLQDEKSRNLWLGVSGQKYFDHLSSVVWLFSGLYLGSLMIYTIIGVTIAIWQRSKLAVAYSAYTFVTFMWYLQNFGIASAYLPFWPNEIYFPELQSFFTGILVIGVAGVCILFLRPEKKLKWFLISGASIVTLLFFSSPYYTKGYEFGAIGLALLAMFALFILVKNVSLRATSEKLFALGLISSVSIGSLQAFSVFTGLEFGGFAIFSFPVGSLIGATFWLMAITDRLLLEFKKIQLQLIFDATHDHLTKLPNRTFLETSLKRI